MAVRKASDSNIAGKKYNDASASATKVTDVPDAPGSVAAEAGGGRAMRVTFTPVTTGGIATSYRATSSPGSVQVTGASSPLDFASGTLSVGTSYAFTVVAINTQGTSPESVSSSAITVTALAPDAPTIGSASTTGTGSANVSFTAPANNGGAPITLYTATASPGGATGTLSQAGSGTISVSGLSQNTAYTFTVKATNSAGQSVASGSSNSITTQLSVAAGATLFSSSGSFSPSKAGQSVTWYLAGGGGSGGTGAVTNQSGGFGNAFVYAGGGGGAGGTANTSTATVNSTVTVSIGGASSLSGGISASAAVGGNGGAGSVPGSGNRQSTGGSGGTGGASGGAGGGMSSGTYNAGGTGGSGTYTAGGGGGSGMVAHSGGGAANFSSNGWSSNGGIGGGQGNYSNNYYRPPTAGGGRGGGGGGGAVQANHTVIGGAAGAGGGALITWNAQTL